MPSRFDDVFDTSPKRPINLMPDDLLCPTSVGEQYRAGGWTRLERPVGGEVPAPDPHYPNGGNAGMDTDNDADDQGPPIAATHPAERSSA